MRNVRNETHQLITQLSKPLTSTGWAWAVQREPKKLYCQYLIILKANSSFGVLEQGELACFL